MVSVLKQMLAFKRSGIPSFFSGFAKDLWELDFRLLHTWTYAPTIGSWFV